MNYSEIAGWNSVASVYDGSNVSLYFNGGLVDSTPITGSIMQSDNDLTLGSAGGAAYYNGMIDEVRIYNKALTASEIQQLSVVPEPVSTILFVAGGTLLVGRRYWKKRKTV